MKKMRHKVGIGMAGLLLCGMVLANHNINPSKDWKALREKNIKQGLDAERVDSALSQCRKKGMTVHEADAFLCPVYTAGSESLPPECVFIKIEEGLAKQVDPARVTVAAEARLDCIRRASRIVQSAHSGRGGEHSHLVQHTCMALESGLPEEVLEELFNRPESFRYGRMIHVVEAGETLQLAGLSWQDVQHVMNDCLDRDLNRMEIFRAIDFILAEHRKGRDFTAIHAELWIRAD